jgi:hypothetical protein
MKKVAYLLAMIFTLALMSTSCEKDPVVPDETLEELYPEWVNPTWMATESDTSLDIYPKLHISIEGNTVIVEQELSNGGKIDEFTSMTIIYDEEDDYPSGTVTFLNNDLTLSAEFEITYNDLHPDDYDFDEFDYLVIYPLSGFESDLVEKDVRFKIN